MPNFYADGKKKRKKGLKKRVKMIIYFVSQFFYDKNIGKLNKTTLTEYSLYVGSCLKVFKNQTETINKTLPASN